MPDIVAIAVVGAVALIVLVLLIWKNKQDRKLIDPDAQDKVEETMMNHDRRKDKI
jgi:hypothetical protein